MLANFKRGIAALTVTCGLAVAAPTADAMTVRVGDPELTGRVAVTVPVIVTCSAFDPAYTHVSDSVSVSVQQASGRAIASAGGNASGSIFGALPLLLACDGTEQTLAITALANTNGPPFHGGPAVVSATASASAAQPCFPGSTGCFTNFISQSASTGPVEARL